MNSWPGAAQLPVVRLRRELERAHDQVAVELGLVGLELGQQLVDKILMPLDYRHPHYFTRVGADPLGRFDRKCASAREPWRSMFRRRRSARRLRLAARLLL